VNGNRVYLESLGCRLNAAELETLAREFAGAGYQVVHDPADADLIVLNTCAVTAQAGRKSRHRLRTLHRTSPAADLAVTGCWVTEDAASARELEGVRWALPNVSKAAAVAEITGRRSPLAPWAPGHWGHTRAFLGVQDGCDHVCTYCVTRRLRGPARSRPLAEVVAAVRELVEQGAQEVVLTGVSLGSYGQDHGLDGGLARLVPTLLAETDIPRLRLSSVEPWDVDASLLRCWESPRLCRQLHLPLQAGSDVVLKRMGRPTTTAAYSELVAAARTVCPDMAITTDVIAGFPGETGADFARTLAFVEELGYARLHVFPYSERAGTAAVRLPGKVAPAVRAERARRLRELGERLSAAYRARFIDRVLPVLWEQQLASGAWLGLSDTYAEVRTQAGGTPASGPLYNRILPTRIVSLGDGFLIGRVTGA
jgi:threonylcarbamoyladenosine tRNA methylthiotransferase MtaB